MVLSRLLSAVGFFFMVCSAAFAQTSMKGIVTDDRKIPVAAATVSLLSASETKRVLTDSRGGFEFTSLAATSYTLTVSAVGYAGFTQNVQVGQQVAIQLTSAETLLQSVEVLGRARKDYTSDYSFSATKIAIKNKDLPQGLATVTKELITDRAAFQLADAVKIASGVSPSSFYNQFNIRGISQNEEGQIVNGMRTRQFYFLQPLTSHIERVEVLKGPASVTFSSVDPGGSINLVTKKPLAENHRSISLSAGSFSTLRGAIDFTGPLNEAKTLLYRFNGAYQEAQSYRDLVKNNAVLLAPSFTYLPTPRTSINTEFIFTNMVGNLDRGQPIFGAVAGKTSLNSTPISLNLGAANDFFKSKELTMTTSLSHKFSDNLGFNAAYMKQTWAEDLQEHRTTNAFARDITGAEVKSLVAMQLVQRKQLWNTDNLQAYFNANFSTGKISHKLVFGYDLQSWQKQKGGGQNAARGFLLKDGSVAGSFVTPNAAAYQTISVGGQTLPRPNVNYFDLANPIYTVRNLNDYVMNSRVAVPSALTTTHAVYVQELLKFGRMSALLSVRNEWFTDITNYKAPNEASFKNSALLPRIGLTYEVTKNINAYATYLEGYQPQSNTVSLMPSTSNFFWASKSAAQFKPLISNLKEAGMKASFLNNSFTLSMAVYEINQRNILMSANDPTQPDLLEQRGADRSRGFETDLAGYLLPNWQINASYSYIDAKIVADANPALVGLRKENVARNSGNLWTRYNFAGTSAFKELGIGLGVNAQGSRVPWFSRAFEVPGFTTVDAALYYTPSKSLMQISVHANNVFNKTHWIGAQNYTRLFPGAPRNFLITATYKF